MMYYGLSLNTGSLPGNIFVNTLISGAVEVPALIVGILLMSWSVTGRRFTSCGAFIVAGLSSLICIPMILFGRLSLSFRFKGFLKNCVS
jgi:OCT family organic cation transporter-like MFS transporter 4/5